MDCSLRPPPLPPFLFLLFLFFLFFVLYFLSFIVVYVTVSDSAQRDAEEAALVDTWTTTTQENHWSYSDAVFHLSCPTAVRRLCSNDPPSLPVG